MHTVETLQAAYRQLQLYCQELAAQIERYRACQQARQDRIDRRNAAVARIIAEKQPPTATLEDWRRILATLQVAEPALALQMKPPPSLDAVPLTGPLAARPISARTLRKSYLKWLKTASPSRRAASR